MSKRWGSLQSAFIVREFVEPWPRAVSGMPMKSLNFQKFRSMLHMLPVFVSLLSPTDSSYRPFRDH